MSINLMSAIFRTEFRDIQDAEGNTTKASTAKFVCIALADHANDEGEGAYPSIAKLAYKTNLTKTAVINALDALKFNGIIISVGRSKWDTVNYTVNPICFSQDSQPALLVNPVDPPSQPGLPEVVNPVDPNHTITIQEPSKQIFLTESELKEAGDKVNKIIELSTQPKNHYVGRDQVSPETLVYADWYNGVTNQAMTKRVKKSWWKALGEWKEEGLEVAHLQEAYDARSKWRTVTDPNELTKDAVAIKALGSKPATNTQPQREEGKGFYA